jgi:cytidine deaminase
MLVYISDAAGNYVTTNVRELLPDSFGPQRLAAGVGELHT